MEALIAGLIVLIVVAVIAMRQFSRGMRNPQPTRESSAEDDVLLI